MHFKAWKSVFVLRFFLENFKYEQYYPGINNDKLPSPSISYIKFYQRCGLESVHKFGMQLTANDTTLIELKILLAICCTSSASLVQLQRANHQENTNKSRDMHEETTNIKKNCRHISLMPYPLPILQIISKTSSGGRAKLSSLNFVNSLNQKK